MARQLKSIGPLIYGSTYFTSLQVQDFHLLCSFREYYVETYPWNFLSVSDFHRCNKALSARDQDITPCEWYQRVYKSLCPMSWVSVFPKFPIKMFAIYLLLVIWRFLIYRVKISLCISVHHILQWSLHFFLISRLFAFKRTFMRPFWLSHCFQSQE